MKIVKRESNYEKALEEVEEVLRKHTMQISRGHDCLMITFEDDKTFDLVNVENRCGIQDLPRTFDCERLAIRG